MNRYEKAKVTSQWTVILWFLNIPTIVIKINPRSSFTKVKVIMSCYLYTTSELMHTDAQAKSKISAIRGLFEPPLIKVPLNPPATKC